MNKKASSALLRTYVIMVFGFMYLPIAVMAVFSFNQSKSRTVFTGFTLSWYKSLFTNELILNALWLSLVVALIASVAATVLGTLATVGIQAMSRRSQLVINNISYIPVANPEIITGVSMMLLFVMYQGFAGKVQALPDSVFGLPTLLIAHITFNVPYVVFNVAPKPNGCAPVRSSAGPGLQPHTGVFQGGSARAFSGDPVGIFDLPHLFH